MSEATTTKAPVDEFDNDYDPGCQICGCCSTYARHCETCGGEGWVDDEDWQNYEDEPMPCPDCGGRPVWHLCIGHCTHEGTTHSQEFQIPRGVCAFVAAFRGPTRNG